MFVKNNITYHHRIKIIVAIFNYRLECTYTRTNKIVLVDYSDMEKYNKTLTRLWDYGYTRILPKEKFEIIKPFIDK